MAPHDLMRRTKIVATIGPATESPEVLRQLIAAGATTFRLNFSHGDHSDHADRIATIRQVAHELGVHIGILQDLQGPKIRLGRFQAGPITLAKGDPFSLTSRAVNCDHTIATVTYDRLADEVTNGSRILLDDGRVEMVVVEVDAPGQTLKCRVTVGGVLSNNKGVNFPDVQLSIRALTPKDRRDLAFGLQQGVDWVALSFVRNPSDMLEIRELIRSHGHDTPVVAKIEKFEAIDAIDAILPLCDGVMVARGDLGVEMPAEEVPLLQKELIRKANSLGIPIITATQMLDSMASCPRPTRAEVSDVANAILDGTDAVMLSNETAVGDYPVEAVATMDQIARRIERDYPTAGAGQPHGHHHPQRHLPGGEQHRPPAQRRGDPAPHQDRLHGPQRQQVPPQHPDPGDHLRCDGGPPAAAGVGGQPAADPGRIQQQPHLQRRHGHGPAAGPAGRR